MIITPTWTRAKKKRFSNDHRPCHIVCRKLFKTQCQNVHFASLNAYVEKNIYLSTKDYCKKYCISRNVLHNALIKGQLHAIRFSDSWNIADEAINKDARLPFHVAYVASMGENGPDFESILQVPDFEEAISTCRHMKWCFDSSSHGWCDSFTALVFIGELR